MTPRTTFHAQTPLQALLLAQLLEQAADTAPNGHVLATSQNVQRVWELDRSGKTVWEYTGAGQVFRARRR